MINRRMFCAAVAGGAVAAGAAGTTDAHPGRPCFVLVPGAFGRAAMFAPLVAGLAERGHLAVAVELPGHDRVPYSAAFQMPQDLAAWAAVPSPLLGIGLADYVAHTMGVVRRMARRGPVILVGASAGGLVISLVANAVPHLVHRLVYDDAFCCVRLPSVDAYYQTPEAEGAHNEFVGPVLVGNPAELGVLRVNWRSGDPWFLSEAKPAFLTEDAADAELIEILGTLYPDDPLGVNQADARVQRDTWGRVPRTFIRHTRDGLLPIALQDRLIAEADELTPRNRFDVHTIEAGHVVPATRASEVADLLANLA